MTQTELYDSIRKQWVTSTPEERVRQGVIQLMIQKLGFPKELLVVEKALRQLPHLATEGGELPDRRLDIACFGTGIHPDHSLFPLIVVECKAVPLTAGTERQVIGYNRFVKAPFVALANEKELRTGWLDAAKQEYVFVRGIPAYQDLLASLTPS